MLGLGVLLALALMSKVSASVLIASVGAAIGLEIVRARPPSAWGRALARPGAAAASPVRWCWPPSRGRGSCATWPLYGQAAPSAYEGIAEARTRRRTRRSRTSIARPIGFYLGWNLGIYVHPIYPTGIKPNARFFPVLLASTFNDYYVYSYSGGGQYRDRSLGVGGGRDAGLHVGHGRDRDRAGHGDRLVRRRARAVAAAGRCGEPDPRFALLLDAGSARCSGGSTSRRRMLQYSGSARSRAGLPQVRRPGTLPHCSGVGVDSGCRARTGRAGAWLRAPALNASASLRRQLLCIGVYSGRHPRLPGFASAASTAPPSIALRSFEF